MIEWLKSFLFEKAFFMRCVMAALFGVGTLVLAGIIPTGIDGGGKLGVILQAVAFLVKSGEFNPKPEEIRAIASGQNPAP